MLKDRRIAFIGAGNMASALIHGLSSSGVAAREQIVATDVRAEALAELHARHGIATTLDNRSAASAADLLVLCVKPQVLPAVLGELRGHLGEAALVVSIAAGVPTAVIERGLAAEGRAGVRVVRAMPNTPALVLAGATAIAPGSAATAADLALARALFASVGVVEEVQEPLLDAVTGLSGSGPAYVFLLVEALTQAGVQVGLSESTSAALAAQTVYGAAKLLHESGESPEALRRKVTSPGGTTQAGLERLAERGFADVLRDAVERATARARELGAAAATPAR
jgi:pyrroline-5-carboxylate reductase